jgi:hypothetical protein
VDKIAGKPEEKPIAFLMLRTMQKARYDPRISGTSASPRQLHALHVAHPALSGSGRPSIAARVARGMDAEREAD